MDRNPLRASPKSFSFSIKSGNYTKNIINAIKKELPEIEWKESLIWTVRQFDFKESRYSQIIFIVQEYGVKLTFRCPDDGISFELTIPELVQELPPRKKFLGIF